LCRQIYRQILTVEKATSRSPFQGKFAPKRQSAGPKRQHRAKLSTDCFSRSCCKLPSAKTLLIRPAATHIAAMSQVLCCPVAHHFCTLCTDCTQYVLRHHCMRCTTDCSPSAHALQQVLASDKQVAEPGLGLCRHKVCKTRIHCTQYTL